jgi:hypothetical protein
MTDIYTGPSPDDGPERSGASKVNGIVYGGMSQIFSRDRSYGMPDPNSVHGQDALGRLHSLDTRGVDRARLAVISGLAHIDGDRRTEAEELEAHREIAAIMEEAPGA